MPFPPPIVGSLPVSAFGCYPLPSRFIHILSSVHSCSFWSKDNKRLSPIGACLPLLEGRVSATLRAIVGYN